MKIEREKHKVNIICLDQSVITGFIHISPGTRVMDFLNHVDEKFIIVTSAVFQNIGTIHAFKLYNELSRKRDNICLNKSAIKWIEEL
jgi:hypothetical protein